MTEQSDDRTRGLYRKYQVKRVDDTTEKHNDCRYFVLDPAHDKFAVTALIMYIAACEKEYPQLAQDLDLWLERIDA